jgi:hypothetical protein
MKFAIGTVSNKNGRKVQLSGQFQCEDSSYRVQAVPVG